MALRMHFESANLGLIDEIITRGNRPWNNRTTTETRLRPLAKNAVISAPLKVEACANTANTTITKTIIVVTIG
jgi:hypothetical protein